MPELPEVETVRRSLEKPVTGLTIESIDVHERRLRSLVDTKTLRRFAVDQQVVDVHRRAKYLLLVLTNGAQIVLHLGMSGRIFYVLPEQLSTLAVPKHRHVVLNFANGGQLWFVDPRRFGLVELIKPNALQDYPRFQHLGVEPLANDFNDDYLYEGTRKKTVSIKNFMMDAKRVVGVGNIYANESLFLAGIRPTKAAGKLSRNLCSKLVATTKQVLTEAIEQGGTTINDFQDGQGQTGYFQVYLRVYGRDGQPCPNCASALRRTVLGGRSTFYCSKCQK